MNEPAMRDAAEIIVLRIGGLIGPKVFAFDVSRADDACAH
jgi:hypothetical protein